MQGLVIEVIKRPVSFNENAAFLENPNWKEFSDKYYDHYDKLYNNEDLELEWCGLSYAFDGLMISDNEDFKKLVWTFVEGRGHDPISSDREAVAFMLTCLDEKIVTKKWKD